MSEKKPKIIEKKAHSLKPGKGNKEEGPSRSPRDPSDKGDPRGSRQPRKEKVHAAEKGDKRRPYKDK